MSFKSLERLDVFNPVHCITQQDRVRFQLKKVFQDPRFRSGTHNMYTLGNLSNKYRTCSRCGHDKPRKSYTSHEWRKAPSENICKECVLPSLYPYSAEKMALGWEKRVLGKRGRNMLKGRGGVNWENFDYGSTKILTNAANKSEDWIINSLERVLWVLAGRAGLFQESRERGTGVGSP
jgi:hypothetical protein